MQMAAAAALEADVDAWEVSVQRHGLDFTT
jgi:hypothetical protein